MEKVLVELKACVNEKEESMECNQKNESHDLINTEVI
jgi:hypothetical protein